MGEGFAFAAWARMNFPASVAEDFHRYILMLWRTHQRTQWWCSECLKFHA